MKQILVLVCLAGGLQTVMGAVGVEISPPGTAVPRAMSRADHQFGKVVFPGRFGTDYILNSTLQMKSGVEWRNDSFVEGAGTTTRRTIPLAGGQSFFQVYEMPTTAAGYPVEWRFALRNLTTGQLLTPAETMRCTARLYFTEKPNIELTGTNWTNAIIHTYHTPGRKEVVIDVDYPAGSGYPAGSVHKVWAVTVTNNNENIIRNEGFESGPVTLPSFWIKGGFGNNTRTHSIVEGRSGQRAAHVTMSNWVTGNIRWQPTNTPVMDGARYRLSYWYTSSVPVNVTVDILLSDGSTIRPGIALPPAAVEWTYREHFVTMPTNAVMVSPYVALTTNGSLVVDDVRMVMTSERTTLDEPLITWFVDDGDKVSSTNVATIAEKYGYGVALAIVTGRVGLPTVLNWNDLRALKNRGHHIVAHTTNHSDLVLAQYSERLAQINFPRYIFLEQGLGDVRSLVPPFGSRNSIVDAEVRDAGYTCQISTESGYNQVGTYAPYALRRMTIRNTTTVAEVKGWIDAAVANKSWLMVAWHHVDGTNTEYSWPKEWVDEVMAYAKSKNIRSVSPEDGLRHLRQET
jgi:hypothetical protein